MTDVVIAAFFTGFFFGSIGCYGWLMCRREDLELLLAQEHGDRKWTEERNAELMVELRQARSAIHTLQREIADPFGSGVLEQTPYGN